MSTGQSKKKKSKESNNKTKKNSLIVDNVNEIRPLEIAPKDRKFLGPLNPVNFFNESVQEDTVVEEEKESGDKCEKDEAGKRKRCPSGQRCDYNSNKCLPKFKIELENNITLEVVQRKNKKYDNTLIEFLNSYIDRIQELRKLKDAELKRLIQDVDKKLKKRKLSISAKYGDLKSELIIQIVYLEHELNKYKKEKKKKKSKEASPSPVAETKESEQVHEITEEEKIDIQENQEINNELDESKEMEVNDFNQNQKMDYEDEESKLELEVELNEKQKELQEEIGIEPLDKESKEYNTFLFEKEKLEHDYNKSIEESKDDENKDDDELYPNLDDPNFNEKIAKHKEFNEIKYDGEIKSVKEQAEFFCNKDFELLPHQLFVKNFMSFDTPYNSLLLYHGLGTGKTCSAIGIAEEMRGYMKQVNLSQRIMVIASPNVQNNFRLQLFDDRKLKFENGLWNLETCIGNALLSEINPSQFIVEKRDKLISHINNLINQYYIFMGYRELGNFIKRKITVSSDGLTYEQQKNIELKKIKQIFNNRLIIIDEVHNLRILQDNKESKKTANLLMYICEKAENIRLLMLSATPMYNSYKEIIWLTNLLNVVDNRSLIKEDDVFDKEGNFVEERTKDDKVYESGVDLLTRKLTGYVSFIRGENPYSFPFRVYPDDFDPEKIISKEDYFKTQLNRKEIENPLENVPVYVNKMGSYQEKVYKYIIDGFQKKGRNNQLSLSENVKDVPTFENMESFGYVLLKEPLESLNIVFPNEEFDNLEEEEPSSNISSTMVGKNALLRVMTSDTLYTPNELRYNYNYKPEIKEKYGNIFALEQLQKYSAKMYEICNIVKKSKGPIIIYSFYIDGGVVPMALALEEMGFTRYGSALYTKPLFEDCDAKPIDALTMKTKEEMEDGEEKFNQAKYVMITGDKKYSPNNLEDLKYVTDSDNKYGENVKVILITKAAAEGLDFKFIRQIHILDPWYNLNRLEQIIGRGVRNLSHCGLPFEERNVEIYLHGSKASESEEEPADMYVYRFAENKSKQIGKVSRLVKETSVDCLLNIGQTNFTVDKLAEITENKDIKISLASNKEIDFKVGDKPFSSVCDYMENCDYVCKPDAEIKDEDIQKNMYSNNFAKINYSSIVKRVRQLFKEQSFYKKDDLLKLINLNKVYPDDHIYFALSIFVENKKDYLVDRHGRTGYLINADDYYAFQPNEIDDESISIFERSVPLDYKRDKLSLELPKKSITEEQESLNNSIQSIQSISESQENVEPEQEETVENTFNKIIIDMENNLEIVNVHKIKYLKIQQHMELKKDYLERIHQLTETEKRELANIKKELVNTKHVNKNQKDEKGLESFGLKTGENDWYILFGRTYFPLKNNHFISEQQLNKYAIHHYLDTLIPEKKLFLFTYFMSNIYNEGIESETVNIVKAYFKNRVLNNGIQNAVVIFVEDGVTLYIENLNTKKLEVAKPSEVREFQSEISDHFIYEKSKINSIFGFLDLFHKKDKVPVFKLKNKISTTKNNKGAQCNTLGKTEIVKRLNDLVDQYPYVDNKDYKRKYTNQDISDIYKSGLCVMTEILMRFYNDKKTGIKWYFTMEESTLNELKKL